MKKVAGKPTQYRYIKYWSESINDWHKTAVSESAYESFCTDLTERGIKWEEIPKDQYPYNDNEKIN